MQRDYGPARRRKRSTKQTARTKPSQPRKRKTTRSRKSAMPFFTFHMPSFLLGIMLAVSLTAALSLIPDSITLEAIPSIETKANQAPTQPTFSFPDMLIDQKVEAEPENYPLPTPNTKKQPVRVQAASFKSQAEADKLRAQLILQGLQISIHQSHTDEQLWYRVVTRSYTNKADARRAITILRRMGLKPILIHQKN